MQREPKTFVCSYCGELFASRSNYATICPDCREKVYRARDRARRKEEAAEYRITNEQRKEDEKRREARRRSGASWKEIAEVQKKAEKAGMSYGQYVARMERD